MTRPTFYHRMGMILANGAKPICLTEGDITATLDTLTDELAAANNAEDFAQGLTIARSIAELTNAVGERERLFRACERAVSIPQTES